MTKSGRKRLADKRLSLAEAVGAYVRGGCSVTFGGFIGRDCVAAAREIVRQGMRDLTLIDDSKTDVADILVGAGCVARWEGAYLGYGALGLAPNIRRAVEKGEPRPLEVEDWSNAAISMRFLAGALNVPFLPTRSLLGSDLACRNLRVRVMADPYGGEPVALVPAARPDVAIIHAQRADASGNALVWGFTGSDENKARAARHVIVTCEEIVSSEEVRRHANLNLIPFYCVDAVVEVPFGCHPQSVYGYYAYDVLFCAEYRERGQTAQGFREWLEEYVFGCPDHEAYCRRVGRERLEALRQLEQEFNQLPERGDAR